VTTGSQKSFTNGEMRAASAAPARLRIMLVDDHEVVRRGLRAILEAEPGWEICAEAADGRRAAEAAGDVRPDVMVLDISMPELNGLEAARQILRVSPKTRILILTMHESEELLRNVLKAGARGYLFKSDAGRELVAAVHALQEGKTYFTSKIAERLVNGFIEGRSGAGESGGDADLLTAREREVIQLVAEGKSTKEVAARLGTSLKTAETHRASIMRKLDLHSISDLVRYAVRNNITQL
jgi:DNA-binding NarL/FixJ family response regulator